MIREQVEVSLDVEQHGESSLVLGVLLDERDAVSSTVLFLLVLLAEDRPLQVSDEGAVRFLRPDLQGFANIFEEVRVADLGGQSWVHVLESGLDGLVLVRDDATQLVARVPNLHEEVPVREVILRRGEEADGDVVGRVINPVDEGDFLLVAFDGHVLRIHEQHAVETIPVAVLLRDVVVVRNMGKLFQETPVRRADALARACRKRAETRAFEVQRERLLLPTEVEAERFSALRAAVAFQAVATALFSGAPALAARTVGVLFLGTSMLKMENEAR
jgi:hypothetical protein